MKQRIVVHQDVVLALFFFCMSGIFYAGAHSFPKNIAQFPRLFSLIMAALTIPVLVKGIIKSKKLAAALKHNPNTYNEISWKEAKYPIIVCIVLLAYILGILYIGFFVSSAVFMVAFMFVLGYKNWPVVIGTTVALLGTIYFVFVRFLAMNLPRGMLF